MKTISLPVLAAIAAGTLIWLASEVRGEGNSCSTISYSCDVCCFFDSPPYGQAVRYSSDSTLLRIISVDLYLGHSQSPYSTESGIDVTVWADDGTGFPGSPLYYVHVPHDSIGYQMNVNLSSECLVIVPGADLHVGFLPTDSSEIYVGFTSEGCGNGSSSYLPITPPTSQWYSLSEMFSYDYSWMQTLYVIEYPNDSSSWSDNDSDGIPLVCDLCPNISNQSMRETDCDGIGDECDNCPDVANAGQEDTDGDGIGDLCDTLPGDADGNGQVSIGDAVFIINYIFGGGPAPDPLSLADADCSGGVSIGDAVYIINYIFGGGPAPCGV